MIGRPVVLALALLALGPSAGAVAQDPAGANDSGADLRVSLVTVGVGAQVWERFGHNMLWVQGITSPLDSVWDWGRFQFDSGFFLRFARGDLRYWMQGAPGAPVVGWYAGTGRAVEVQELALTPAQRLELLAFLRANDTDAARYYQYHYYNDNCSTRIRDALDHVLGGALRARTDTVVTAQSYRDQTRRLNEHNPFLYFGLTTLLAGTTDRRITAWEEMFLPSGVQRWVREVRVPDGQGGTRPLVLAEGVVAVGGEFAVPDTPSRWWPGFLAVGLGIMAMLALAGRSRGGGRRLFLPAAYAYLLVAGLFGVAMVYLWGFSRHEVAWRNENLFQFNLLALALLPLLPAAWQGHGAAGRLGRHLAVAMVAFSVLGLLLKALPWFGQSNWDVLALALPANLGLLLGLSGGTRQG